MDNKLFNIFFLDFSKEAHVKKSKAIVLILYYFTAILISIWLRSKLGFKFTMEFSTEYFISLFSELNIIIPFFLFLIVLSISRLTVFFIGFFTILFLHVKRYYSYKKIVRKERNDFIKMASDKVIEIKDVGILKGEKFDKHVRKMISYRKTIKGQKNTSQLIYELSLFIFFIYVQIVRTLFENLFFLPFAILLGILSIIFLISAGYITYIKSRLKNDEEILFDCKLLDKNYYKKNIN